MLLYARYPDLSCTLNYYYIDGNDGDFSTRRSQTISNRYRLLNPLKDEPIYPSFKGWTVDGELKVPSTHYPWYPEAVVTGDVDVFMSACVTWTIEYDRNGGSGSMPTQQAVCTKRIDESTKKISATAVDIELLANEFIRDGASFGGWKVDGEVLGPGSRVHLDRDRQAIARWLWPTVYNITVRCIPDTAGEALVQDTSQSHVKKLHVQSVQAGYFFKEWQDTEGNVIGKLDPQTITLPTFSPAEIAPAFSKQYRAIFNVDPSYTMVEDTSGNVKIVVVVGKLTRTAIEGALVSVKGPAFAARSIDRSEGKEK